MEAVFVYFASIGAGLAVGVGIVILPALWLYQKIMNRKKKSSSY